MKHYFKISEAGNGSFSAKKNGYCSIYKHRLTQEPATFKMEFFAAIVNGFQPWNIVVKTFTSDETGLLKSHVQNGGIGVSVK